MNILYKIGDLYNLLVDALFWLLYDKIGIKKVKQRCTRGTNKIKKKR